ncbi:uncharacterized protein LOC123537426 [Mercenaria mercenaria]|uniref:uncharacterized protein LOC123537426 n=1 Tax=Mercenaria mercenaria TaxID=6596 RepID=UPI00234F20DF|nr:uncharacterized protein LOC123537426 [Mercenaria mercenaria]
MLVEGVIIQGWLHNDGNLKFISSFKVLYGFNYDNMAYYSDSFGPKVFYISNEAEYNFTQTFWFSKPFLTGIVGLEIPSEENSCLKAEFIVCKRNVERNCASAPKIGWQSLTERSIPGVKFQTGRRTSSYSACLQKCKRTSLCNAFQYNNSSRACRLSIDQPLPPSYSFRITRNLSFTYKLCVEEVTFPQNISSETIITSPNYPHYYGDHIEYIWNVRVTDAVALNIDVLDVFMPTVDNDKSGLLCYDRLDFGQNEKHANRVEIASKQDQHYHRQSRIISEKGNQLFIRIKSCYANRAMPFRGFAIKITKSDCPACKRKQDCNYPCGYIQSHYFPTGMYQKSSSAVIFKAYTIRGNNYEYVKIHIIYLDVPEKRTVFLSFADISPEGTSITTNIDGISMPYPIFYSQNNFLHVSCPYSVSTENNGYQLRYSLMKMRNWKESVYHMNTSKCEPGWMFFKGSCYTLTQFSERTYLEARRSCKSNGADLAIITSIEESNAINFYLLSHRNFVSPDIVFGLGVKDNKYKWIDGSRAIFQNWFMDWSNVHNARPSLPMVDACAVLRLTSSQSSSNWIVQRCRTNYTNAICEKRLYKDISANLKPVRYNLKLANRTLRKTTFKCIDGSLIDWTGRCDQFNDCPDNSDEFSCDLSSSSSDCKVQEFQCENKQCIPISRYCDYIQDCDDASDERACVRPDCNNDEFRCENGQCVPDSDRCDIKIDCLDESDELDCANVNCTNGGKLFSCPGENACIPMSNVCDGFVDCPGTSGYDEANCEHVMIKSSCEEWYRDGFRQSGTYKIDLGRIVGVVDISIVI